MTYTLSLPSFCFKYCWITNLLMLLSCNQFMFWSHCLKYCKSLLLFLLKFYNTTQHCLCLCSHICKPLLFTFPMVYNKYQKQYIVYSIFCFFFLYCRYCCCCSCYIIHARVCLFVLCWLYGLIGLNCNSNRHCKFQLFTFPIHLLYENIIVCIFCLFFFRLVFWVHQTERTNSESKSKREQRWILAYVTGLISVMSELYSVWNYNRIRLVRSQSCFYISFVQVFRFFFYFSSCFNVYCCLYGVLDKYIFSL